MSGTLLALLIAGAAPGTRQAIEVPRGGGVVVDGRLGEDEWRGAVASAANGIEVRLLHDGENLFVGIVAGRPGFASVCLGRAGGVDVLHASAALGSVRYGQGEGAWTTAAREFVYGMRSTGLDEGARAERSAYFAEHGWVASTFAMGGGTAQEVRIGRARLAGASAIAVAFFIAEGDSGVVARWPATLEASDGCAHDQLVRGYVPPRLSFDPASWAGFDLGPEGTRREGSEK